MERRKMKPTKIPKIFQLLLDSPDVLALAHLGLRHGEPYRTWQVTWLHTISTNCSQLRQKKNDY
jgi:hypothetical protein